MPPIPSSYKSPFVGKKAEDVATWLWNKPEEVELDIHFFAILDKIAEEGNVIICRQGGSHLEDMSVLEFLRLRRVCGCGVVHCTVRKVRRYDSFKEKSRHVRSSTESSCCYLAVQFVKCSGVCTGFRKAFLGWNAIGVKRNWSLSQVLISECSRHMALTRMMLAEGRIR
jgi:hypothetical protein